MAITLDATDRKILCELDCESRQSLSSLGKKVRLSKEAVHYRIKKLESAGIITGYPAIISLAKLGNIHVELFLKFHNVTVALKEEMVSYLVKNRNITYVASCKGSWDMLLGIIVNSLTELNDVKNYVFDKYSPYFLDSSISLTIETYFYGRKYLVGKDIHMTCHVDKPGYDRIDEDDRKILKILSTNSRMNPLEIARQTKQTARSVAYRIKKMEKEHIIQKYTVVLDTNSLNISVFKLFLNLKNSSHKKRFLEYFHMQPNTINVREVISSWNLEPTFEVTSTEEFYSIVHDIEQKFGESITSHSSVLIDREHKVEMFPSLE